MRFEFSFLRWPYSVNSFSMSCVRLTVYEAQTGSRQIVFVQKLLLALPALLLFPALNDSTEDQMIAAPGAAQSRLGLQRPQEQTQEHKTVSLWMNAGTDEHNQRLQRLSDLADEGPVLHAVIEGVSRQTGRHRQNGKNAGKQSRENQDLPQTRVTRHAGHTLAQRRQILSRVQHT